jgi:hypothetical protein
MSRDIAAVARPARRYLGELLKKRDSHARPLELREAALRTIGENRAAEFRPVKVFARYDGLRQFWERTPSSEQCVPFRAWLEPLTEDSIRHRLGKQPLTDAERAALRELADGVRV